MLALQMSSIGLMFNNNSSRLNMKIGSRNGDGTQHQESDSKTTVQRALDHKIIDQGVSDQLVSNSQLLQSMAIQKEALEQDGSG